MSYINCLNTIFTHHLLPFFPSSLAINVEYLSDVENKNILSCSYVGAL
jgi:hypothetical protein